MGRRISGGTQDFAKIRERGCFYVDKTDLIREWWEGLDDVTLITRPRRFGKTLNLGMLDCFFSARYAGRGDLFEGLSIWNDEAYRKLQGTYPAISISFADVVKGTSYEAARGMIVQILIDLYNEFSYLLLSPELPEGYRQYFSYIRQDMGDDILVMSIKRLSMCMEQYYGKRVLIFLDEYDTPLQEAYLNGYWEKLVVLIRGLFNAAFKTNPYLERALLTGITRVSKESIFSDLNNMIVVTTTSEKYSRQFGFTQEEVVEALAEFGMQGRMKEVKTWYDGFIFGSEAEMYNPWSICCFLDTQRADMYWVNTSSNRLIGSLMREGSPELKRALEQLLEDQELVTAVDEEIVFQYLSQSEHAAWSLLLASGYLRVNRVERRDPLDAAGKDIYHMVLTNLEVKRMFRGMIASWFENPQARYNEFIESFRRGDLEAMNVYMNKVALAVYSHFDGGNQPSEESEPERFYHGLVLGLLVEFSREYILTSNRESGFGRYDVTMEPRDKKAPAYVLEFKVYDADREASLDDTVQRALAQIVEKQYDADLILRGVPQENIRHYGFAFCGKTVKIGMQCSCH